jgi:hypothetical protein
MMKKYIIITALIFLFALPVVSQKKLQENVLKREVTLYNPYKPSLPDVLKKSFLPDMTDTSKVRPDFKYVIKPAPFTPGYFISPVKPASLLPDQLPNLYNGYVNIGLGNFLSPLAEVSITNQRSKKGAVGFYGRHFSTNGKIRLENDKKVFAGYMDNDAIVFGRKFLDKSVLSGSLGFSQKTRYAYGYNTLFEDYSPSKKDIRINYENAEAQLGFKSANTDSSNFAYNFNLDYNYFHNARYLFQHSLGFNGMMAKSFDGFFVGSATEIDLYMLSDSIYSKPKYIVALSPFIKKSTSQWSLRLGFQALLDRGIGESPKLHIYPDINFSFDIIPSYISFFTGLSGKLEKNDPLKLVNENPFLLQTVKPAEMPLFTVPNTDYKLIVMAGLQGNTGINGTYQVSASYSLINNILLYTNYILLGPLGASVERGNHFLPLTDDIEMLKLHAETGGSLTDKLTFKLIANYYNYTLTKNDFAWNKPDWDGNLNFKYNLKDKIFAGVDLTAIGRRRLLVSDYIMNSSSELTYARALEEPIHFNLNLGAEYRYTKILSFWVKLNNIAYNRYYEWAFYPSQRFLFMAGFTYSL